MGTLLFLWFASLQDPAEEIVRSAPGVLLHVGCGGGAFTARLAENGNLLVHALESEERMVAAARRRFETKGLYGRVTVESWGGRTLPHGDNLINVIVAEKPVDEAELLRVLAPGGTAWGRAGSGWKKLAKPRPAAFDEWTHGRHGADGNMVSKDTALSVPTGLRWVAGPPQDAGGRKWYFDHVLVGSNGRNFYICENTLVARDAWNGLVLWTREIAAASNKEKGAVSTSTGAKTSGKAGNRTTKVQPVAAGDKLFAIHDGRLIAMDGASGRTTMEYGAVEGARELLVDGGRLIVADKDGVRAYRPDSLAPLWEVPMAEIRRVVAADGKVFCLAGSSVAGLDAATGKARWRTEEPRLKEAGTLSYGAGVLAAERSTWQDDPVGCGIQVFSGGDGALLWSRDSKPGMTHYQEARAIFARGRMWLLEAGSKLVGLDPRTGREEKSLPTRGKHCAAAVATERFFLAPECDFTDFETGEVTRARMFKSACRMPFVPANGLLYTFPVQCECYPMLRGYMALGNTPRPAAEELPLLRRGAPPPATARVETRPEDWPAYRHDAYRSGSTPSALRDGELRTAWRTPVARPAEGPLAAEWKASPFIEGTLTPPVAAGGVVVVAAPHEHRVLALDAATGRLKWSFTAGGRVDTPPTIAEGLCLFGAHDGWVYAVGLADGALAWRYRAAPQESRIMAYGQLESPWPVAGSVLVAEGIAYAAAGRHPLCDGGVRVVALKAATGDLVWEKKLDEFNLKNWYGQALATKKKVGLDFEPVDLLVKDGDRVSLSRWRFDARTGAHALDIASAEYQAPGVAVPRGLWGYGIRQTKMVLERPPAAFDASGVRLGKKGEVALILAAGVAVIADAKGELRVGGRIVTLPAPPVPDGLIVASGRLYAALQDGSVACFE